MIKEIFKKYAIHLWIGSLVLILLGVMLNFLIFIIIGIIIGITVLILNNKKFRILSDEYWSFGLFSLIIGILMFVLLKKKHLFIAKGLLTLGLLIGLGLSPLWFYTLWFFILISLTSLLASVAPVPYHDPPAVVMEYQIEEVSQESQNNEEILKLLYPDLVDVADEDDPLYNLDSAELIVWLMRNEEIREMINNIELDYAVEYDETQIIIKPLVDLYITNELEDQAVDFIEWIEAFTNSAIDQVIIPEKFGAMVPELILGVMIGKLIDERKKKKKKGEKENKHLSKLESDLEKYQYQVEIHKDKSITDLESSTIAGLDLFLDLLTIQLEEE